MNEHCINLSIEKQNENFPAFKEHYSKYHLSDYGLLTTLQNFREYYNLDNDWFPVESSEFGRFTRFLNEKALKVQLEKTDSTLQQDAVEDIYDKLFSKYSPKTLEYRMNMLINAFREEVDKLMAKDNTGRTRAQVIESQASGNLNGYQVIMGRIFDRYEKNNTSVEALMETYRTNRPNASEAELAEAEKKAAYRAKEFKKLVELKEYLTSFVAPRIGEMEGFVVNTRDFRMSVEEQMENQSKAEQEEQIFPQESVSEDGTADLSDENTSYEEGTNSDERQKGDRYVDYRTFTLMSQLGPTVRRFIKTIPRVNSRGQRVSDDIGAPLYMNDRYVANVLAKILTTAEPGTMMDTLRAWSSNYTWLNGLVQALEKDVEKQGMVYTAFKKAETVYLKTIREKSYYELKRANSLSQGHALAREAGNNLSSGLVSSDKSVVDENGILKSAEDIKKIRAELSAIEKRISPILSVISMVEGKKVSKSKIQAVISSYQKAGKDVSYLTKPGPEAMQRFLDENMHDVAALVDYLHGIGYTMITEKNLFDMVMQPMSKKSFGFLVGKFSAAKSASSDLNKLAVLLQNIQRVYGRAEEMLRRSSEENSTGTRLFNTSSNAFNGINNCLALAQYNEIEARVTDNGKSLNAYNNNNLLHQIADLFSNKAGLSEEQYLETIEREFLRYEGYAIGTKESVVDDKLPENASEKQRLLHEYRGYQVHGWLDFLMKNAIGDRGDFGVIDISSFNKVEYAGMSRPQFLADALIHFVSGGSAMQSSRMTNYAVPIQADYSNAYNFITAPRYSMEEVIDELTYAVMLEAQRIANIEQRKNKPHTVLDNYERYGSTFLIFPEMETNGFREDFATKFPNPLQDEKAFTFARDEVERQIEKVRAKDIQTYEKAGVFANNNLRNVNKNGEFISFFHKSGKYEELSDKAKDEFALMSANNIFAKQQIAQLFTGGLAQFEGIADYEKRNMMLHAPRTSLYTTIDVDGKEVKKTHQTALYIKDPVVESAFLNEISDALDELLKQGVITEKQHAAMLASYKKIKPTDGKAYRTLESYREVQKMAQLWNDRKEKAYKRLKAGNPTKGDIDVFMEDIKPVYTGYESVDTVDGQKPVKLTVLHKYSESVLLPLEIAKYSLKMRSTPMDAFAKLNDMLGAKDKVDLFIFHSDVKVGAHSMVQPFAVDKEKNYILRDADSMAKYMHQMIQDTPAALHRLSYDYFGIAASTRPHFTGRLSMASQAEKVTFANIVEGDKIYFDGKELVVDGKTMSASDIRELYFKIKTAEIVEEYEKLRNLFANSDELERILREELASKSYNSADIQFALAHLKDGKFSLPLFSPNVEHQIQALFSAIIKKRLAKPTRKGAHILQTSAFGFDKEKTAFEGKMKKSDTLGIVFDKKKNRTYFEASVPLEAFDVRLKQFADENGAISAERLNKLVEDGIIPEEMLFFVSYRTPSDATHSVLPCRVKEFTSNLDGSSIILPKEAMVTTGHDNDGDTMYCFFSEFDVVDNDELLQKEYDEYLAGKLSSSTGIMRIILGLDEDNILSFERFKKLARSKENKERGKYRKASYISYDYEHSPLENSKKQKDNGRLQMMFSYLSSPSGINKVLIPGECESTKVFARTMDIIRRTSDAFASNELAKAIASEYKMSKEQANKIARNSAELYQFLTKLDSYAIKDLHKVITGTETPFSVSHAVDSYDYIMSTSEMIGIYAMYNSALAMMQRIDVNYEPKVYQKEDGDEMVYDVELFGNEFGKLFRPIDTDRTGQKELSTLKLARLLQAAVDNPKDPILGYLNQIPEFAPLTSLFMAAGLNEEQIHLIFNQPAVIELGRRLRDKTRDADFVSEVKLLVFELAPNRDVKPYSQYKSLKELSEMSELDFADSLRDDYQTVRDGEDLESIERQIYVLQLLRHLNNAAEELSDFVKLTRPDSDSGSIGSTIPDSAIKWDKLWKFRNRRKSNFSGNGMRASMKQTSLAYGTDTSHIFEQTGDVLPEVVALNSLLIDGSFDVLREFFPQAKDSWVDAALEIAGQYRYRNIQPGIIKRVYEEMILWKLLNDKKFVSGNLVEEQKRVLKEVPYYTQKLIETVRKAQVKSDKYPAYLRRLFDNQFLYNIGFAEINSNRDLKRLKFNLNGTVAEGTIDGIRMGWNELLHINEKVVANDPKSPTVAELAVELFKYNMFTNGFGYGMYEFSHFAPYSVLAKVPGYIPAMRRVQQSEWRDEFSFKNFLHQYYMNHWDNEKLVPQLSMNNVVTSEPDEFGNIRMKKKVGNPKLPAPYYLLKSGDKNNKRTILLRNLGYDEASGAHVFQKAEKLGYKNKYGQALMQYNPNLDYFDIKPVINGDRYAKDTSVQINPYAEVDVDTADKSGMRESAPIAANPNVSNPFGNNFVPTNLMAAAFGLESSNKKKEELKKLEEAADKANNSNGNVEEIEAEIVQPKRELSNSEREALQEAVDNDQAVSLSPFAQAFGSGLKLGKLRLVTRDENGKIVTNTVQATPDNIQQARRQKVFAELNKRLRNILASKGVSVGVINETEARLGLSGVADFDTATVTAEGLKELIRLANGVEGEMSLPEEFAHTAVEMLGHNHPLVKRLMDILNGDQAALEEAFEGQYEEYAELYGDDKEKMVIEAIGKLVAKHLFYRQEVKSHPVRNILRRIADAIKSLFKKFRVNEIQSAIDQANGVASDIAKGLLGGRLLEQLSLDNVSSSGEFYAVRRKTTRRAKDLSNETGILNELLKTKVKQLDILKKRLAYDKKSTSGRASLKMIQDEIKRLEAAIKTNRTEEAICVYINDSIEFLKKVEENFNKVVSSGRSANAICKYLNITRDTLESFSVSLQAINDAIVNGEIQETEIMREVMNNLGGLLDRFGTKYRTVGKEQLKGFLSEAYGEDGVFVTVGKDKGRQITIEEMASRSDRDISFASYLFNTIADCNDYILKAVSEIVRNAKQKARERSNDTLRKIQLAVEKLHKETGSYDQDFMFEYKVGKDGKPHKTGKYISEKASEKLSPAQKEFYDAMMNLKKEIDRFVPESYLEKNKIIMVRKLTMERFKSAEGAKDKALVMYESLKNRIMESEDSYDPEYYKVSVDFEGNRVDMLPVKFLLKGKSESYDDMTDDVATSMMAYASMAHEYNEMNGIVGIIENAKYMASERDITQRTGRRIMRESIGNAKKDRYVFHKNFTVKQARTTTQKAFNDFLSMHVYGHIRRDEGTFGDTKISKRKTADAIAGLTAFSQMALNIPQRIANILTGKVQIWLESDRSGEFNKKDVRWANKIYATETPGRIKDVGVINSDNKLSLWAEKFDIHQDNGRNRPNFKKGRFSRVVNSSLLYLGLTMGEDYLALTTALALARNIKLKGPNGESSNLWDAYEVKYTDEANHRGAYLKLKDGYTKEDGTAFTAEDERNFMSKAAAMNFQLQGIYNQDDKSAIQQFALGALFIMYRKWIAPAIKRRYGRTQYNKMRGSFEEGYYTTFFRTMWDSILDAKDQVTEEEGAKALWNIINDIQAFANSWALNRANLTEYEHANMRRAWRELATLAGLFLATALIGAFGPGDDDRKLSWWEQQVYVNMLRLRSELGSTSPTPLMLDEGLRILGSPFAAIKPVRNTINGFRALMPWNMMTEVKSGKYKGHSKSYKYFHEIPVFAVKKKIDNFIDPTPMINFYKNEIAN